MIFTTQPILALALLLVSYASLSAAMCAPMGGIHGNQSNCVYSAPVSVPSLAVFFLHKHERGYLPDQMADKLSPSRSQQEQMRR